MGKFPAYLAGLCILACGVGASGRAAADGAETVWVCWYDRSTSVLCRLLTAPPSMLETVADSPEPPIAPVTPRTGRPVPAVVYTISQNPAQLASRTLRIPLHNHAQDMDAVEQLADAVMCGARRDCRVLFERG